MANPRSGEATTANYGWTKPNPGASDDIWGGQLNADLDGIDSTVHAIQTSIPTVPAASATQPVMDGTATAGSSAAWSRGDHVHPSDTTKYNTSNPSGYQTAANVTASLASYLPLSGGTLTGNLIGTNATLSGALTATGALISLSGNVACRATGAGNAQFICQNNASTNVGSFFWATNGQVGMQQIASSGQAYIDATGNFYTTAVITAGTGFGNRAGTAGSAVVSNPFNFFWTGSALQAWIATTNVGNVGLSSDYRIKKDIAPLPDMWETVKALNPISYTHQDYTPPGLGADQGDGDSEPAPLIVGDDIEHWGFIAHELQETLIASAATGVKDQADCIQSPNVWPVIATLTKALQEAMARIEALEAAR